MRLRHFLLGTGQTNDFAFLAKGSDVTEAELRLWKSRLKGLTDVLRDKAVPADDFMRLFVPGLKESEWAYMRVRTGGERAKYDLQAVILSTEEMERLWWQPWALDGALFEENTRDARVQALKERGASPRDEYDTPTLNLEFDGEAVRRPRLEDDQKGLVERLLSHLGGANGDAAGWYLDEGLLSTEGARAVVASLLMRLHESGRTVPGFVMGLSSSRASGPLTGVAHKMEGRLPDIRLASYKRETGGAFPLAGWLDVTAAYDPERARDTNPLPRRGTEKSTSQTGRLDARDRNTAADAAEEQAAAALAARLEEDTRRTRAATTDGGDDPHTSTAPDVVEAAGVQASEAEPATAPPDQTEPGVRTPDAATDRSGVVKSTAKRVKPDRDKPVRAVHKDGLFDRVKESLDQSIPLAATLIFAAALIVVASLVSYLIYKSQQTSYQKLAQHAQELETEKQQLRAELEEAKAGKITGTAAPPLSEPTPVPTPKPEDDQTLKNVLALVEATKHEDAATGTGNVEDLTRRLNEKAKQIIIIGEQLQKTTNERDEARGQLNVRISQLTDEIGKHKNDVEKLSSERDGFRNEAESLRKQLAAVDKNLPNSERPENRPNDNALEQRLRQEYEGRLNTAEESLRREAANSKSFKARLDNIFQRTGDYCAGGKHNETCSLLKGFGAL